MRVLLVDDEAIQRKALRTELARLPIRRRITCFKEASNGRECLEVMADYCPHIVFLDLRMPVMGGLEVARVIAEEGRSRIVILTAYDDFKFAQEALQVGAIDYLLKPASREDLARVMNRVCDQLDTEEHDQREKDYLTAQLEKVRPLIELEYVNDIVNNSPLSHEAHLEKLELLNVRAPLQLSMVLEIDDYGQLNPEQVEPERQALKQRIAELMREEIGLVPAIVARLGTERIIALLGLPEALRTTSDQTRTWFMGLAETVRARVNTEYSVRLSIGLSRIRKNIVELHLAYEESMQALSYKFMLGSNQIVHVDDVDMRGIITAEYPIGLERQLLEAVRLGNTLKVSEVLPNLLSKAFIATTLDPSRSRIKATELFVIVSRAAGEGGAPQEELFEYTHATLNHILSAQTLAELRQTLEQGIQGLIKLITGVRNVRNQRLVTRAIDYIKDHYQEQVSLDDLARLVYLSPFYFSHIFKDEVGTTFIEYLTQVRIEEAKRRLRDTMVAVSIIAEQVGYNDVNYFSRVFKKVVGQTPTQYRGKLFEMM